MLTRRWTRLWAVPILLLASIVYPQSLLSAQYQSTEPEFLLLEIRLDQSVLSDAIPAYDIGEHTLLPLGELARLLTIAIKTQPGQATANGFILTEDRGFSLNLAQAQVTRAGVSEKFDPALVLTEPDDIYVATSLLERWLPVELEINRSSLSLRVYALEALPLQARLKRERLGEQAGMRAGYEDPGYPQHKQPYRLLSMPFIDQTFASELLQNDGNTQTDARYTAFLTGDLLGMESSLYFSSRKQEPTPDVRATLGRHDPDGGLLGPLQARSFQLGSISAPSVDNVTRGVNGEGVILSNRPLTQPTSFDRQVFEGDLPPGWDVELYYNDALVGFQLADSEGRYRFEEQPLSYGRNDFQLVFNGPLGQTRVEQYSFSLAQSMVPPGEFQYSLTEHRDDEGKPRSVAQFDLGLSRSLSVMAGFTRAPVGDTDGQYTNLGMRTFWQSMSISGDFVQAQGGGSLAELGMQTRVGGVAVDASRIHLNEFNSDVFLDSGDAIRTRDELRFSGSIPVGERSRLPVTVEARRDELESGVANTDVSARVSAYVYRTALTNTLNWRASGDIEHTLGTLRISRRVRDMSFRSQLNYTLGARSDISVLAFTADKSLGEGYRTTLGVAHTFVSPQTRYTGGFTKSLGRYGLGVNASYVDTGEIALGAQLFVAMGRDPRQADWLFDARPMANSGAASVQMFLDDNNNGVMDADELPLSGAGFTVNGGRHKARTNAAGIAHINHLPVKRYVDIGVDMSTLEDPQWSPQRGGLNLVPRPGTVAELEFPVRLTTEIDGTVYLLENDVERGIGDLELELLNDQHEVVGETTSSWDGFYIVPQVVAGEYWLRISPQQLRRLGLRDTGIHKLTVSGDGSFISGVDFLIIPNGRQSESHSDFSDGEESKQYAQTDFRKESWVQDQPADYFTVQLMAASSEATVKHYMERHQIKQMAAYVRTLRRGLPWYSVIYGNFSSYQEARTALDQLPPSLTQAKPWVRRFGDLQAAR
ncbi:MAG: SPOR domain-containing protein [Marinobacter sp.]|uniref:SPOR domain-containing protein n=1 Tax=Marinobacter sp. TaxID=50741 RepID=UPI0034A0A732